MIDAGLVLEGGAVRGVFTAGVLDYLMEQDLYCNYVVGVSAGSCNAVDYVSRQIGRTKECFIPEDKNNRYISPGNLLKGKALYDMDKVFIDFPSEIFPFDFKTFFKSESICEIVTTNCMTGKAEYMEEKLGRAALMEKCRASSSMPLLSPMVTIEGIPYLDGGLADSVPIKRAIERGYKKNIVVLTRNAGYRKEPSLRMNQLCKKKYQEYDKLVETIEKRAYQYNETMDYIDELEKEGQIFVIRPEIKCISKVEFHKDKLTNFYRHGYQNMKRNKKRLLSYLNS